MNITEFKKILVTKTKQLIRENSSSEAIQKIVKEVSLRFAPKLVEDNKVTKQEIIDEFKKIKKKINK